jgi:S1-C subfamily serine protease
MSRKMGMLFALCMMVPSAAFAQSAPKDFSEGIRRVKAEIPKYLVQVYAPQGSTGTGVLIRDEDGILGLTTNAHVVGQSERVMVRFEGGGYSQEVEVLGKDPAVDIALLKVPENLPTFAQPIDIDTDPAEEGDMVYAAGYPFSNRNLTFGVITSLSSPSGYGGVDVFYSHQVPLAPGNSGGALIRFKSNGKQALIGLNTAISKIGLVNFSIRASVISRILPRLKRERTVIHAAMGLGIADPEKANPYSIKAAGGSYPPGVRGIVVIGVGRGSPADRTQIKEGDIISKFEALMDGEWIELPVTSAENLANAIFFDLPPDTRVRIQTNRGNQTIGRELVLEVLEELKQEGGSQEEPHPPGGHGRPH